MAPLLFDNYRNAPEVVVSSWCGNCRLALGQIVASADQFIGVNNEVAALPILYWMSLTAGKGSGKTRKPGDLTDVACNSPKWHVTRARRNIGHGSHAISED